MDMRTQAKGFETTLYNRFLKKLINNRIVTEVDMRKALGSNANIATVDRTYKSLIILGYKIRRRTFRNYRTGVRATKRRGGALKRYRGVVVYYIE